MFILGPLLDGPDHSFDYGGPLGEMLERIPSPDAVPRVSVSKVGRKSEGWWKSAVRYFKGLEI